MEKVNSGDSNSRHLFLGVTIILVFIILTTPPIDADMWWHLKAGQTMFHQRAILTSDPFSFTRFGHTWVNAFWVSDLILYCLYKVGGFHVLIGLVALVGVLILLMIYNRSKRSYFIRSIIILLAAISISPQWTARPQIFSFLLFTLLLIWLEKRKSGNSPPLYFLPLLFIVWVNVHGGFIWGFLLLFATMVGSLLEKLIHSETVLNKVSTELKQLVLWTSISVVAILFNPNGISIWRLPFYTISVSIKAIQEWSAPNFHSLEMQPFLWMIFLLIVGYALSPKKHGLVEILPCIGFIYMAFISQRNIPIAVIVITPILIDLLGEISTSIRISHNLPQPSKQKASLSIRGTKIINSAIIILLLIAASLRFYIQLLPEFIKEKYPVNAVQAIRSIHPKGNMFNSYNWGGYLIWSLPEYPVFIDGRADLYGESLINEWWDIVNGNANALSLLDKYQINLIILEPDWPIIDRLRNSHWTVIFKDDHSIVMTRQ